MNEPAPPTTPQDISRQRLEVLYEVSRALPALLDANELVGRILDLALETTGAERGVLFLRRADGVTEPEVVVDRRAAGSHGRLGPRGRELAPGRGLRHVLADGELDWRASTRRHQPQQADDPIRSFAGAGYPLLSSRGLGAAGRRVPSVRATPRRIGGVGDALTSAQAKSGADA